MLPPIHPGEVLLEDFMKPLGLSQYRLAHDIGVAPLRISQIVHGQRAITVDTAMRLARYFGTNAPVWMRLQVRYDLEVADAKLRDRINREVKVLQRPATHQVRYFPYFCFPYKLPTRMVPNAGDALWLE